MSCGQYNAHNLNWLRTQTTHSHEYCGTIFLCSSRTAHTHTRFDLLWHEFEFFHDTCPLTFRDTFGCCECALLSRRKVAVKMWRWRTKSRRQLECDVSRCRDLRYRALDLVVSFKQIDYVRTHTFWIYVFFYSRKITNFERIIHIIYDVVDTKWTLTRVVCCLFENWET